MLLSGMVQGEAAVLLLTSTVISSLQEITDKARSAAAAAAVCRGAVPAL
jgi:hypothetical protein